MPPSGAASDTDIALTEFGIASHLPSALSGGGGVPAGVRLGIRAEAPSGGGGWNASGGKDTGVASVDAPTYIVRPCQEASNSSAALVIGSSLGVLGYTALTVSAVGEIGGIVLPS